MRHAEKICRKIKQCQIPFSPKASIWICRPQVYYLLLCFHKGNIKNRGHLKGAARQCNIPDPRSLSISEILIHLDACKKEYTFYQEHGQHFCWKHLNNWPMIAKEQNHEGAFKKISAIIRRSSITTSNGSLAMWQGRKGHKAPPQSRLKGRAVQ